MSSKINKDTPKELVIMTIKKDVNTFVAVLGMLTYLIIPVSFVLVVIGVIKNIEAMIIAAGIVFIANIIWNAVAKRSFNWYKYASLKVKSDKLIYSYSLPTLSGVVEYTIKEINGLKVKKDKIVVLGKIHFKSAIGYGSKNIDSCDVYIDKGNKDEIIEYLEWFKDRK